MEKPQPPKKQKPPKKTRKPSKPAGITLQEFERRMKQRENALVQRYAAASSPQLKPLLMQQYKLRGAANALRALIDPDNAEPIRLPGGKPTFVVKLRQVLPASIVPTAANAAGQADQLKPNSGFSVKLRDPRCSQICYQYDATGASTYNLIAGDGTVAGAQLQVEGWLNYTVAQLTAGIDRHGDYYLPWIFADGLPRFWFGTETSNASTVLMTGLTASTGYTLKISVLLNGVVVQKTFTATSDAGGIATFTINSTMNGFCAFGVYVTATGVFARPSLTQLRDNSKGMTRFLAAPQFWQNFVDIDSIRTNAASLMYSDRTASQFSQGDICSYQASGGDPFEKLLGCQGPLDYSALDPYGTVPSFQNGFKGPYKKGKYIPLKLIDDPREHQLINISDSSQPWDLPPIVFANQTDYLFIGFNFGLSQAGAPTPMGEWTAVEGDEGECDSQWRETKIPHLHPDVLKEVRFAFSQQKCDFENPSHLSRIWSWVKQNAPHILDVIGKAVGNAGPYGAAASAGLGGVSGVLRALD